LIGNPISAHLTYLFLGCGTGAVIGSIAIGLVLTHRASGILNLAHAAMGMYIAVAFYELRSTGDLILPILGLPDRLPIISSPTVATALSVCMILAAIMGIFIYFFIIRPLRNSPPLSALVASLGLLIYLMEIARLRIGAQGATGLVIDGILPTGLIRIGDIRINQDRIWLVLVAFCLALLLAITYRYTRFGRESRAVAENERGAYLLGISSKKIGVINWILASMSSGFLMILAGPATRLDVNAASFLIVPALAAALLARLTSFLMAAFAGLWIGMLQSELMNIQVEWSWLPDIGIQQGVPLLIILIVLAFWGDTLPLRGTELSTYLPKVPDIKSIPAKPFIFLIAAVVVTLLTGSEWRLAIAISGCVAIISSSVVVITGFVGQVSLATYAFAGIAAFMTARLDVLPFPLAPLIAAFFAVIVGVSVGLIAVRVRGLQLAVATLAASVAIEELLFRWPWLTGGDFGTRMPAPSIFGLDLGISAVGTDYPRRSFVILVIVTLALCLFLLFSVRSGITGRQWLAVRANERAASSIGINVARAKLTAFGLSAFLAGIGGALIGYQRQIVSARSFGLFDSMIVIAIVYLAGIAMPSGAVLAGVLASGGVLTVVLGQISDSGSANQMAFSGLLLLVAAIRLPSGIIGSDFKKTKLKLGVFVKS
jgi:branched-chain amino acid transport system permease protein